MRTIISYPVNGHEWSYILPEQPAPLVGDVVEIGGENYVVWLRQFKFDDNELVCHGWPLKVAAPPSEVRSEQKSDLATRLRLHVHGQG